jgi:signal transduction histidine kinase
MSAYLAQARSPLAAIRTLGALLTRQLAPNEPPRDLAAVIIEQSERLGDLTTSLQAALFPGTLLPAAAGGAAQASLGAPGGGAVAHAPGGQHWGDAFAREAAEDDADTEELWSRPDEAGPAPAAAELCDVSAVLRPLLGALDGVAQAAGVAVIASLPGLGAAHSDDHGDHDGGPVPLLAAVSAADARRSLSAALEATLQATPAGGTLQVQVRGSGAMLCVDVRCTAEQQQMARAPAAAAALRGDAGLRLAGELLRARGGSCDPLPGSQPGVLLRFPLPAAPQLLPVDAHVEADALDAQIADE